MPRRLGAVGGTGPSTALKEPEAGSKLGSDSRPSTGIDAGSRPTGFSAERIARSGTSSMCRKGRGGDEPHRPPSRSQSRSPVTVRALEKSPTRTRATSRSVSPSGGAYAVPTTTRSARGLKGDSRFSRAVIDCASSYPRGYSSPWIQCASWLGMSLTIPCAMTVNT
jgi:hypothetical protein